MLVMIGMVGLAIDTGYAVLSGNQLQNAADAGALAGAQIVRSAPSGVKAASVGITNSNAAAGATLQVQNSDVTIGTFDTGTSSFSTGGRNPNAVRVVPRRANGAPGGAVPLFFGGIFGSPSVDMSRTAIAMVVNDYGPALMVLHPTAGCSLDLKGSSSLVVLGGTIQVNSSAGSAVCAAGSTGISAPALNVYGGVGTNGGASLDTLVNTGMPPLADPLASLPAPTPGTPLGGVSVKPSDNITLDPGYYNGGLDVKGMCTLNQGIYIIGGSGLHVNGLGHLYGDGVMLYLTGNNASLDMSSNGANVTLIAPDPARHSFAGVDTYAGVTIFQDRTDTQDAKLSLAGTISLNGTLYFPSNALTITSGGSEAGARFIVSELHTSGSASITIDNRKGNPTDGRPFLVQ
jgi:hypothetical protein